MSPLLPTDKPDPTTDPSDEETPIAPSALGELCNERRLVDPETLEQTLTLAVELAREGREGRKIGTIFIIGDHEAVLARSRSLILDPLAGHPDEVKRIGSGDMRETVKELALLDGGFVLHDNGTVLSAARYFYSSPDGLEIPLGLGSRHMAAASITKETQAAGIVVSESSIVRLFEKGRIVREIIPELWLLRRHGDKLLDQYTVR